MLKNYFVISLRTIFRNKLFSFINIAGLAVSMSVGLIIIMLVSGQMAEDRHINDADRIYRINYENLNSSRPLSKMATCAPGIATKLSEEYVGVEQFGRLREGFGNSWLPIGDNENIPLGGFFADQEVLDLFQYSLEYGDVQTALTKPRTVVLTKTAAEKLFTQANPVGEFIKVGELGDFRVTGVMEETDTKSHIKFEALASMASLQQLVADSLLSSDESSMNDMWNGWTYIKLADGVDPVDIESHLAIINEETFADDDEANYKFYLQNLLEINPGPLMGNQIGPVMPLFMIYFLGILCFLIIVSACFNYTTLSVARAMSRAREVGVRKVSGAMRTQIFGQFISEAILVAFFALLLSFVLLPILKPAFEQLYFAKLLFWELSLNVTVVVIFVLFAVVIGLMAGLFPSIFMSTVKPITVLRDFTNMKLLSGVGLRKTLLVAQFVLSLFLIISVKLIQDQVTMMTHADYGFNPKEIVNIQLYNTSYETLSNELQGQAGIKSVAASSHVPGVGRTKGMEILMDIEKEPVELTYFSVDQQYIPQMELEVLHGTNFPFNASKEHEQFLIINETAAEKLGYDPVGSAIGQPVLTKDSVSMQIIGVVRDYNHEVMITELGPMALRYMPELFELIQVKHDGDKAKANQQIEAGWKKVNPDLKISYRDMTVEIAEFYDLMFSDLVAITSFISFIAISISCLGLLGMAVYTAETRAKEVSIRKVLGANSLTVMMTLSKGYALLLLISVIIATPLSLVVNNLWLDSLAYHVDLGFGTVSFGVGIILILGLITIVSQTLKAANSNTVEALRGD